MNTPLSGAFLVYTRPFRGSGCAQRAAWCGTLNANRWAAFAAHTARRLARHRQCDAYLTHLS